MQVYFLLEAKVKLSQSLVLEPIFNARNVKSASEDVWSVIPSAPSNYNHRYVRTSGSKQRRIAKRLNGLCKSGLAPGFLSNCISAAAFEHVLKKNEWALAQFLVCRL